MTEQQKVFMKEALALAENNVVETSGGPFGAVVVKDGKIIARGKNTVTATNDPTAHAEINAIRNACKELNTFELQGCEIYSSCEPCPMCLGAIYWSRFSKLYFAGSRTDAADAGFDDSLIYHEMSLGTESRKIPTVQMMREGAKAVFEAWKQSENKIPY